MQSSWFYQGSSYSFHEQSLKFIMIFYRVLPALLGFLQGSNCSTWLSTGFYLLYLAFYRVLPALLGFLQGSTCSTWFSTGFYLLYLIFYRVLPTLLDFLQGSTCSTCWIPLEFISNVGSFANKNPETTCYETITLSLQREFYYEPAIH